MRFFKTILPLALVAGMVLTLESCQSKGNSETIEFVTHVDSIGYMTPDFNGDTVYSASRYSVVWPEKIGQQDFDILRDSLLNLTFGVKGKDFAEAAKEFTDQSINEMRELSDSSFVAVKVPYEQAYDAERQNTDMVQSEVSLLTPDLLVVDVYNYHYNYGAAHGLQTKRFLNYSIKEHTLLTADNFFTEGSSTAILDLINSVARQKYDEQGALFDEPIASFQNFQITDDSIVFVYQPYEVAPYSTGIVEVPVSTYDLTRFLTHKAKASLGIGK